jgi:outer membrane protein assembly factor BamB
VSSFAVHGDRFYTQEQRGDDEVVASYRLTTGEPVWRHQDLDRFWDSHAGAGPRSTPTLSGGRVYTLGATGILNVLDARDGAVVWSRQAAVDTDATAPGWGFASSPVVVDELVIVAVGGALAAYDRDTGDPRWVGPGPPGGENYSSPHLLMIDGVQQVLLMNTNGATSLDPASGTVLWEHAWRGVPIVQPAQIADGELVISTAGASGALGLRRLGVAHGHAGWTVEERWTSTGLKPYFNDFVVHEGQAFGFDGSILAGIDLNDGARMWKGGRYGHGQLLLLPDQDLLLVLTERGELALVEAVSDGFTELTRFQAIEGKTWNHPVLVGDVEMGDRAHPGLVERGELDTALGCETDEIRSAVGRHLEHHDVGFHQCRIAAKPVDGGQRPRQPPRVVVVVGQARDMVVERIQTRAGQNSCLAHAAAEHLAIAMGTRNELLVTRENRPHRGPQTL